MSSDSSPTVFVASLLSLFLKSFSLSENMSASQRYEAFLNVPWTFSDVGFFFNYDSFHFPSRTLTQVCGSSHPLPSHLSAFKDIAKSAALFFISPVSIFPDSAWNHAVAPSPPCFFICLSFPTTSSRPFLNGLCRTDVVFPPSSPMTSSPLPSCPLEASVCFDRLRRPHWFTERLVCPRSVFQTRRSAFRLSHSHILVQKLFITVVDRPEDRRCCSFYCIFICLFELLGKWLWVKLPPSASLSLHMPPVGFLKKSLWKYSGLAGYSERVCICGLISVLWWLDLTGRISALHFSRVYWHYGAESSNSLLLNSQNIQHEMCCSDPIPEEILRFISFKRRK